jgi:hypothetical protein
MTAPIFVVVGLPALAFDRAEAVGKVAVPLLFAQTTEPMTAVPAPRTGAARVVICAAGSTTGTDAAARACPRAGTFPLIVDKVELPVSCFASVAPPSGGLTVALTSSLPFVHVGVTRALVAVSIQRISRLIAGFLRAGRATCPWGAWR